MIVLQRERFGTTHECLSCGKTPMDQDKASKHICVDPEGQLTCVTKCPDGLKLAHMQRCLLYSSKHGHLCHHCGDIFSNKTSFDMHLLNVHGQTTKRSEKYKCSTCGHSFGDGSALRHHQNTHIKDQPKSHICDMCGKAFKTRDTLYVHRRRVHLQSKRYPCEYCSKTYYGKSMWKTHMQQHLGESPYHCKVCNQGFSSNYCLTVHMRIHTGEKPYKCKECDAAFAQKNSLDVHMKKHQKLDYGVERMHSQNFRPRGGLNQSACQQPAQVAAAPPLLVCGQAPHFSESSSKASGAESRQMLNFRGNQMKNTVQERLPHLGGSSNDADSTDQTRRQPVQYRPSTGDVVFPVKATVFSGMAQFPGFPNYTEPGYGLPLPPHFQPR